MSDREMPVKLEKKVLLSTLWLVATVNYIFCDVVTLMNPEDLRQILTGKVGAISMNQGFLLGAAIMMEIPFLMIILARVLKTRVNRWVNIFAGSIMTVVQVGSLFAGTPPTLHYMFFSLVEVACTVLIVRLAWRWKTLDQA